MPTQKTTWARESARLAFFAVSMGEKEDNALLGLFEQANNALESYLTARQVTPPSLIPMGGPAPTAPLPRAPSRPMSITAAPTAPPLQRVDAPQVAPLRARTAAEEPSWLPDAAVCKQFCAAFAAIESHLPKQDYDRHLAVFDVCSGRGLAEAARDRRVDVSGVRRAMQRLKQLGPKTYLDAAIDAGRAASPTGLAL